MITRDFNLVFAPDKDSILEKAIFTKKNINKVDFLNDSTTINTYINHFNYIEGKILNKKIFCEIVYLMKSHKINPRAVLHKISEANKIGAKPAHIKVSGRDYTIPLPINKKQSFSFLLRHIVKGSNLQKNKTYSKRLFLELGSLCFLERKSYTIESFNQLIDKFVDDRIYLHYRW
jgi:ribosomal protein S7